MTHPFATEPPKEMVDRAINTAQFSGCSKSQRGVVAYMHDIYGSTAAFQVLEFGTNGPPQPFQCDGSPACRKDCSKRCIHAESRALRGISKYGESLNYVDLVHVKVVDGVLAAGGGPSCVDCSKEILDVGVRGVWLYEISIAIEPTWCFYAALEFHRVSLLNRGVY